ncbi:MAG: hypothetical protein KKC84_02630 [Candidatus Omnitrophica bacterium]|nr:hypothetical protein [Candidatus Omnitrophota bacterium]
MFRKKRLGIIGLFIGIVGIPVLVASAQEEDFISPQEENVQSTSVARKTQAAGAEESSEEISEEPQIKLTAEELWELPISLDLRNMDIMDALKYIGTKGSLNVIATKNVSGRVMLTLNNVPLKDVFDLMLRSNDLAYIKKGEVFHIMTGAEYKALYGENFTDLRKVKIIHLQYATPDQAVSFLDALKSEIGKVIVDQESGGVLLMDTPEKIEEMEKSLKVFEQKGMVTVFDIKYANAQDIAELLKTRLDSKNVGSIKADARNNQVLVQTFPERMVEIERLIKELDTQTRQVFIETKVIKIKLSDQLTQGVEWEGIFNILNTPDSGAKYIGSYPFSAIQASTDTWTSRVGQFANLSDNIASYPFSGTTTNYAASTKKTPGEVIHYGEFNTKRDYDIMMKMLTDLGETRVLSNPKILATNNQESKIHVGERQAYVTQTTTQGAQTSTIAEEVQFVDVGIQISVTPSINTDGFITMKIKPEISTVSSTLVTPTNNRIPIIDSSMVESTVMVKNGTTIVIGGLRKEEKTVLYEQLPIIGKIPFIGTFAKSGSQKTERTELVILMTPHIVSGKVLTYGDEDRGFYEKMGKDYQEYLDLPLEKSMLPGALPTGIDVKPYRDYLSYNVKEKGEFPIKEHRYDTR